MNGVLNEKRIILYVMVFISFINLFSARSKNEPEKFDEMYYGNSNAEINATTVETVKYTIKENKVLTDDYSFELPEGYEVKWNENYISTGSTESGIDVSVDSFTDDTVTLDKFIQKRKEEIYKTGYEISEPKEIEIYEIAFTELRIGMLGKSETDPIGCEYIHEGESGIITVSTFENGFTAIDTVESEELVKQLNLDIK